MRADLAAGEPIDGRKIEVHRLRYLVRIQKNVPYTRTAKTAKRYCGAFWHFWQLPPWIHFHRFWIDHVDRGIPAGSRNLSLSEPVIVRKHLEPSLDGSAVG
jgi:hypothetical protein